MDLQPTLGGIHQLRDLARLVAALGHTPRWERVPETPRRGSPGPGPVVVGQNGDFPWLALAAPDADRRARALARRWAARGRLAGVLGLAPERRRLTVALAFAGAPTLTLDLAAPGRHELRCLERLAGAGGSALAYTLRAADALAGEAVGSRFFHEFRATVARMAARLPGPLRGEDRRSLALLHLTRVLFLYFVHAKGWLDGRDRFLADAVDACLSRGRRVHRDLLRPLFFGTLNRPASERSRAALALGALPFLNGGLFEPHPLERRLRGDLPNDVWRDAFDRLFERFHFTVAEGAADGRIAPDMLGRVFEGVMAPDARRASGTYYTPSVLVSRLLDSALVVLLARRVGHTERQVERMLTDRDTGLWAMTEGLALLDPAVGSGAFLLGALERLAGLAPAGDGAATRRAVLRRNLFGVDRSPTAVRLTELRLWLAVVADDPADRPDRIQPLPNLDCMVRQGDSLFDPAGAGVRLPPEAAGIARELAEVRPRVVASSGPEKRAALHRLAELEHRATAASLAAAERDRGAAVAECLREARGGDLFGGRRGLDRELRLRLAGLRRELHAVRRLRRALQRDREIPWFNYQCHFADVFARGGFDLVVGNPPWLRAQRLPAEQRRRLAGRYRWWRPGGGGFANRPDLAVAFLERSLELAAPDGVVALLVPAKLATAGYGAAARHSLAAATTLHRLADLSGRPETTFDATVYPLAVVAGKSPPEADHRVGTELGRGSAGASVLQSRLRGGGPWILVHEPLCEALAVLQREHPRLDAALDCHLGLKTGANRIFLDPPGDLEPELLRQAVRGRDVRAFRVEPRHRLLFTHGPDGIPYRELPPRAASYLAGHLVTLRARADYTGGAPWSLFRAGPAVARHRVVWSDLARRLTAAALTGRRDQGLIPLNTCYVAPTRSALEAERLAAWLNATWLRAGARAGAVPAAGGFARFTAAVVGRLPLPSSVLTCCSLPELAAAGRRGEPVQEDLDEITAGHLGLTAGARSALRDFLAGSAGDRG